MAVKQESLIKLSPKQPLEFDVRIQSIKPSDSIKGTASVNINGAFAIRGVKIIEGTNGLFVSMPSYKVGNDYKDICFPCTSESRKEFDKAVIGAYEQALAQGQDQEQKEKASEEATQENAQTMTL